MKCRISTLTALSAAVVLTQGAPALAGMSKAAYLASKERIAANHEVSRAGCDPLKANAKDVCIVQARGAERTALADLLAEYKPTTKSRYDARLARADAVYSVAREKCDDERGGAKDACMKEARLKKAAADAEAKAFFEKS